MGTRTRQAVWVAMALLPVTASLVVSAFVPAVAAVACPGRVASDFNGDLIADLLVGDPLSGPEINGDPAGAVTASNGTRSLTRPLAGR